MDHSDSVFSNLPAVDIMNEQVQQRIVKVIAEILNQKESDIRPESSLQHDLQATSLDQMTLFIALEDEFERSIPQEEVSDLRTVKDIIDLVCKKLQQPSPT